MENYDLAIIGGGTAGLTAADIGRLLGKRVALIEKNRVGGDCTWYGCVPSKALLAAAKAAHHTRTAGRFGVQTGEVQVDFGAAMDYVRATIHSIYEEETPDVLRSKGIAVYETRAQFIDPHTLALETGEQITAKRFLIATGASAIVPAGFRDVPYLTNHTLFDLDQRPEHLIIIGGGPIGTEMAQAFCRLGTKVTVISADERLLPRDDPDASYLIMEVLRREGVDLRLNTQAKCASGTHGDIHVQLRDGAVIQGTHLLLAVGRRPHIDSLNLSAAGVETHDGRLRLTPSLRTTQKHIYAAGDVTGGAQFTHYAGWQAGQALTNMYLSVGFSGVMDTVPHATFTDPEVAGAGLTEAAAWAQHGNTVQVTRLPITRADRAVTEGSTEGFMKLVHTRGGKLLGVTIVGANAAEMINPWVRQIGKRFGMINTALTMNVYPTLGTGNVILAIHQIDQQLQSGVLGRVIRGALRWR